MSNQPWHPTQRTSWRVRLLIFAAALGGLFIMFSQAIVFVLVFSSDDFPSPFTMFDEIEVTYENRTDQQVIVYIEGRLELSVAPNSSETVTYRKIEWWFGQTVSARDLSGNVIYATKLDRGDLKELDYRIAIERQ